MKPLLLPVLSVNGWEPVPVQSRSRQVPVTVSLMPDTVDTVIWAPDDEWRYHPKHAEQFTDINELFIAAIDNSSIERVEEFKYLGTTLTNQNSIQEEIKSRLRLGNACYYSVQNLLSSKLLSKNLKIKIYRTIILPVVLFGCETWSLTLREERRLRVFENRVLRRVFGPKRDEVTGEWRK